MRKGGKDDAVKKSDKKDAVKQDGKKDAVKKDAVNKCGKKDASLACLEANVADRVAELHLRLTLSESRVEARLGQLDAKRYTDVEALHSRVTALEKEQAKK